MVNDYDSPRVLEFSAVSDDIRELQVRTPVGAVADDLDVVTDEPLELPGLDLAGEELVAPVVPRRADEFMCVGCFLVQHNSRVARRVGDDALCPECA